VPYQPNEPIPRARAGATLANANARVRMMAKTAGRRRAPDESIVTFVVFGVPSIRHFEFLLNQVASCQVLRPGSDDVPYQPNEPIPRARAGATLATANARVRMMTKTAGRRRLQIKPS
jgi:hypothetical protein